MQLCGRSAHASLECHISKVLAPIITIEDRLSSTKTTRAAKDAKPPPEAEWVCPGQRCLLQIEVKIIRDEQIEVAIAVIVDKSTATTPTLRRYRQTRGLRDVFEPAAAAVS